MQVLYLASIKVIWLFTYSEAVVIIVNILYQKKNLLYKGTLNLYCMIQFY